MDKFIAELNVGDVFRLNRARKRYKIVNEFVCGGESFFNYVSADSSDKRMHVISRRGLCGVRLYCGNLYDGVAEVNGYRIRRPGGALLETPKLVTKKAREKKLVNKKPEREMTDFEKFKMVQRSGKINMTDIVRGAALAGISEAKYEDILFNYEEYRLGNRK